MTKKIKYAIGYFLNKSKKFKIIVNQLNIIRADNVGEAIKNKSMVLYFLYSSYNYYFVEKIKNLENKEKQKKYWDEYSYSHHISKNINTDFYNDEFQKKFYVFMDEIVGKNKDLVYLDIGCGSFYHIKKVNSKYINNFNKFIGVDLSNYSRELYEEDIKKNVIPIQFCNESILTKLNILNEVNFVTSHSVLMYLSDKELDLLLQYIKEIDHNIYLIFEEPTSTNSQYFNVDLRHYHDFYGISKKYGFKTLNIANTKAPSCNDGTYENVIISFQTK